MERCTIGEIAQAVQGKLVGNEEMVITDITTDSRKGAGGSLFVALVGERFDGNDFAQDFLLKGDAAVVEREMAAPEGKALVIVPDTRKALRDIASFYRDKFDIPFVAVTGSVGKTSTKDMIASVLSKKFNTLKTQGNFNNEVGLPLTIFNLDKSHDIGVVEMGMNHLGEISRLSAVAKPQVAVITNIGTAHIGNLGSQQNILRAKLEILESLKPNGIVVLNGDDKILYSLKGQLPHSVIYYGIDNLKADVLAYDIVLGSDKSKFKVNIGDTAYSFEVNAIGEHHIYNALAAIITGLYYKMDVEKIREGVSQFVTGQMRQSISKVGAITIIDDCYNASEDSMKAALKVLSQVGGANRKVAILGDILEQGDFAEKSHRRVGDAVVEYEIDKLITIGKSAAYIADQARKKGALDVSHFEDNEKAAEYILSEVCEKDTVLFKASRGMMLEEISARLKAKFEE